MSMAIRYWLFDSVEDQPLVRQGAIPMIGDEDLSRVLPEGRRGDVVNSWPYVFEMIVTDYVNNVLDASIEQPFHEYLELWVDCGGKVPSQAPPPHQPILEHSVWVFRPFQDPEDYVRRWTRPLRMPQSWPIYDDNGSLR